ncbi:hypothetical protein D4S03_05685 [bacterium]|nr:MAG: hypothetical protein D4S03_05685 [bacterium]
MHTRRFHNVLHAESTGVHIRAERMRNGYRLRNHVPFFTRQPKTPTKTYLATWIKGAWTVGTKNIYTRWIMRLYKITPQIQGLAMLKRP